VKSCTSTGDISRCCGLLLGLEILPYPGINKNIATSIPSPQTLTPEYTQTLPVANQLSVILVDIYLLFFTG